MDMEEERIREALNAHWRASADGDAIAEHVFTLTIPFVIIRSQASEFWGAATCRPCGVIIPEAVRFQGQANSRKRQPLGHGIHHQLSGASSIHREHYGIPRRQSSPRDPIFRGPFRGSGMAEAMGSGDYLTPH